ncbi:RHS repeat-associated core domain-containing protein [Thermomonas beijingensis]|uniref:RHS repeat-associated core domain-containing protein n=1 Tax=Thermomonas beijingensis TaxID=2872701 RepID=UPI001CBECCDA|nr:RHS repeat-associated core domain-containing protein [Thermomonas beijingensis]
MAEITRPIGSNAPTISYFHTDALGSPIAKTNAAGAIIETSEYEPYGRLLNRANDNRAGYTGHVMDAVSGLTYMQQRYFDPQIGRFLSVDPVTATSVGGNFNRYWYANNNPYRFTDPDGRQACDGISTCRVATEERLVASGQMTQQQKQANDQARGVGALIGVAIVVSRNPIAVAKAVFSAFKREAPDAAKAPARGTSRELPGSDKQFGKKYGEHRDSSREGYRSPQEYRERANEVFNSPKAERTSIRSDAPEHAGETHIREGGDLLRLDQNGNFRSMYPDP